MTIGDVKRETETDHRIKKSSSLVLFLLIVLAFAGCDSNRVFEDYYSTGGNGWNKDSVAVFQFDIESSSESYNFYLNSRNIENYPYSNLWLFVEITSPDRQVVRDTVELKLAEPNGKWLGKGTGGVYTHQVLYRANVYFPVKGDYAVTIENAMRDDVLKGLKDVGIRLEKAN